MKLRRIVSLLLVVVMLGSMALTANAVTTDNSSTGAFYNQNKYASQVYNGDDLGFTYTEAATTWKVWSPAATAVQLKLYNTGTDRENGAGVIGTYDMSRDANFASNGVWSIELDGNYKDVYYTYLVTAKNTNGDVVTNETQDIYSKAVGCNGDRSMVVDLDSTDPLGWEDDKHVVFDDMTRSAVWELHIRDFSCDPESGISKENQGKYLAFTEGGTTLQSDSSSESVATGIDYLVEQGINTVQLMPFADYDQVDEINGASSSKRNWGYNPKNYNVPDGTYASDAYDGNVRINEVKQMIQALHDRGISVVMDVVYNHTAGYEASCFTKTVPGYYYRMYSDVQYANGSGQGCELASENAMTRNYIIDSLLYWVEEYHIDGFRFDLMACIDITTLNKAREAINNLYSDGTGKKILMYGEPWAGGESLCTESAVPSNASKLKSGVGMFAANMRDAATAVVKPEQTSWIDGSTSGTSTVVTGIKANEITSDNTKNVIYAECHDNLTLWDKITDGETTSGEGKASVSTAPNANSTDSQYTNRLKLAGAMFMTSQGVTFMQLGTEFARTKQGQENSYNSSDEINQLDWSRITKYKNVVEYYRGLNKIHEVYSPFSDDTEASVNTMNFISQTGSLIAYTINNETENKANEWGKVAVLLNNSATAQSVNLGSSGWVVVANDSKAGVESLETVSGSSYTVQGRSAAILVEASSYKDFSDNFKYGTLTTNHYVDDTLVNTATAKYKIGMKYHALLDDSLLKANTLDNTVGTPSGTFTGDTTVNYYYKSNGKTVGTITINYVDANNRKITPSMSYELEVGEKYSIPVCSVEGYQLNTDKYPANTTGIFDGTNRTITFTYKPLDSQKVIMHYKKTRSDWTNVLCYAYTDDGDEPLGAWKAAKGNTQARMTAEGDNWYRIEIPVASCKVMFYSTSSTLGQEPGQNEPGYPVAGECWVENKVVTYNATTVISNINIDTGAKLTEDRITTEQKLSTDKYSTTAETIADATLEATPANAEGFYQPGVTNIVYLYKGGTAIETTVPPTTDGSNRFILGDSNCDKTLNIMDVTYIQQAIVSLVFFDDINNRNADVDKNGRVNIKDATYIQRYLVGMEVPYDIGISFDIDEYTKETEPTTSAEPEYQTVLFTNGKFWTGEITCYYWDDEDGEAAPWPGVPMTYVGENDYGQPQYSIDLPVGCNCIFTNNVEKTADLVFTGAETGFYPEDTYAENGGINCGSW